MATVASGLNSGSGFGSSDTITSTTLNNHVNNATVTSILTADISDSSSKTTGVTFAKMQHISTAKVLGNVSGSEGDVSEVSLLDEDNMSSDSATSLATQQSIKAYVDNEIAAKKVNCLLTSTTASIALNDGDVVPFNSEISDTSGLHDNSTNNSRITIGTAGVYILTTTITTNETDNGDASIAFLKNGSTEISRVYFDSGSTGSSIVLNLAHTALLSASDYVEVKIVQLSGDSTVVDGTKSTFNASLVS